MIKVEIEGLKEYRDSLEKLGGNFKIALKRGVMKGARKVAKDANSNAEARGFSMGKYFNTSEAKNTRKSDTSIVAKVGTKSVRLGAAPTKNKADPLQGTDVYYKSQGDYYYIKFPEFGTVTQAPKPTLQPALESNKEYITQCVVEAFEKEIKRLGLE